MLPALSLIMPLTLNNKFDARIIEAKSTRHQAFFCSRHCWCCWCCCQQSLLSRISVRLFVQEAFINGKPNIDWGQCRCWTVDRIEWMDFNSKNVVTSLMDFFVDYHYHLSNDRETLTFSYILTRKQKCIRCTHGKLWNSQYIEMFWEKQKKIKIIIELHIIPGWYTIHMTWPWPGIISCWGF